MLFESIFYIEKVCFFRTFVIVIFNTTIKQSCTPSLSCVSVEPG
jgi:hypothetical protein